MVGGRAESGNVLREHRQPIPAGEAESCRHNPDCAYGFINELYGRPWTLKEVIQ